MKLAYCRDCYTVRAFTNDDFRFLQTITEAFFTCEACKGTRMFTPLEDAK